MLQERRFYLTKNGLKEAEKEYKKLKKLHGIQMRDTPPVLHSDELDAEYLSFQENQEYLEGRLRELENILNNVELIKAPPKKERDKVHLGAQVTVEVDGEIDEFMIVGTVEANPSAGKISDESPVGKALLNHKVNDEVVVHSSFTTIYKIRKIKY